MESDTGTSERVSDAELFDMLFGPVHHAAHHGHHHHAAKHFNPTSPGSYSTVSTTMSDPGSYGSILERCWEPGEIVDQDLDMQSTSSASSSSPVRHYQHRGYQSHHRRSMVSKITFFGIVSALKFISSHFAAFGRWDSDNCFFESDTICIFFVTLFWAFSMHFCSMGL